MILSIRLRLVSPSLIDGTSSAKNVQRKRWSQGILTCSSWITTSTLLETSMNLWWEAATPPGFTILLSTTWLGFWMTCNKLNWSNPCSYWTMSVQLCLLFCSHLVGISLHCCTFYQWFIFLEINLIIIIIIIKWSTKINRNKLTYSYI